MRRKRGDSNRTLVQSRQDIGYPIVVSKRRGPWKRDILGIQSLGGPQCCDRGLVSGTYTSSVSFFSFPLVIALKCTRVSFLTDNLLRCRIYTTPRYYYAINSLGFAVIKSHQSRPSLNCILQRQSISQAYIHGFPSRPSQ